jgi:hypothetical protein
VVSAPEVPGRRELQTASRAVTVAARRLTRSWALALLASALFVLMSGAVTIMSMGANGGALWPFTCTLAVFTALMVYNVTRFLPRQPEPLELGVTPSPRDAELIADWVASRADGWRPNVRLSPDPTVHVDLGELVLGLPMVTCLREEELAALVRDARDVAVPDALRSVERALRITRGGIGRGLWNRRGGDAWVSRLLVRSIHTRAAELEEARSVWARTLRARRGERWRVVATEADTVIEGWEVLAQQWLEPALQRRRWHADPFTGLRHFLEACRAEGFVVSEVARPDSGDAATVLPAAALYERTLAELLVRDAPHARQPTPWIEHPVEVTAAEWRMALAEGLDAARRATGLPQPATVENLLGLLESGWADGIAALLATPAAHEESAERPSTGDVMRLLLEAAVSVALIDAGVAVPAWTWPHGTDLLDREGRVFAVSAAVASLAERPGAIREWLTELGVDPGAPLWLAEGVEPGPEQPIFAVETFRWMRTYHLVATDRSVHLFRLGMLRALGKRVRMRMHGRDAMLLPTMQAVRKGDFTARETGLELADVVRATFSPMIGGHWWRLQIHTPERRLVVRGDGLGRETEQAFAALLGDRLSTRWLHAHRWLLYARNGFGFVCFALGLIGLVGAAILLITPGPTTSRTDAGLFAVLSVAVLALGFLPDLVAEGLERLHHERSLSARSSLRMPPAQA